MTYIGWEEDAFQSRAEQLNGLLDAINSVVSGANMIM